MSPLSLRCASRLFSAAPRSAPVLASIAALLAGSAASQAQSIINLGVLDPSHQFSQGVSVSADGSVVAGHSAVQFFQNMRSFRWTAGGGAVNLGELPNSINMVATSVSADGNWIAGSSFAAGGTVPFRWSESTGLQPLTGPGAPPSGFEVSGISGDGAIVSGTGIWDDNTRAVRWTAATGTQDLGALPGGAYSFGTAVSANGHAITGFSSTEAGEIAFIWTEADGMQPLPALGDVEFSAGIGISADASVIAGYDGNFAARWVNGVGASLGAVQGGAFSVAYALSGDGAVAGGLSDNEAGDIVATIWTESLGMVDLNTYLPTVGVDLTGWNLSVTTGISFDGTTLVGSGTYNGAERGWYVTIPTPTSASLLGVTGLLAARRRRR